jgi:hypothetical protein
MNRALPPGDCGNRASDQDWASGPTRAVSGARGLVGGTQAAKRERPPRQNPGGWHNRCFWGSTLKGIAAFSVLSLSGVDRQPHLLADGSGQETPYGMRLPAGGFHDFLQGGAAGLLQEVQDLPGLAALADACGLRLAGFLGGLCGFDGLFRRRGLLPRLGLGRRNAGRSWRTCGLRGGYWLLAGGLNSSGFGIGCDHLDFSFGGDYRRHAIHHSAREQKQVDSEQGGDGRAMACQYGPLLVAVK